MKAHYYASDAMITLARERMPTATFVVGDAFDLPFPDDAFERLWASSFYWHLLGEERVLTEGSRWQVFKPSA